MDYSHSSLLNKISYLEGIVDDLRQQNTKLGKFELKKRSQTAISLLSCFAKISKTYNYGRKANKHIELTDKYFLHSVLCHKTQLWIRTRNKAHWPHYYLNTLSSFWTTLIKNVKLSRILWTAINFFDLTPMYFSTIEVLNCWSKNTTTLLVFAQ